MATGDVRHIPPLEGSSRSLTLVANAQNIDLASLLPTAPTGFLRVTGAGPTGAGGFSNIEVNGVASTGYVAELIGSSGAWAFGANGPIVTSVGMTIFDFIIDARAGTARVIVGKCEVFTSARNHYTGGWNNTNTAILTGLRILGPGATAFSAGFRVTVEEI